MNNNTSRTSEQNNVINLFRELWGQYILLTRTYMINNACNLGNLASISQSIIQGSKNFYDAFLNYYGSERSKIFELLLDNHYFISAKLLYDMRTGDADLVEVDRTVWYQNANFIAQFLSEINPNWNKAEWQTLIYNYLYMLEKEIICRYATQDELDEINYAESENQALIMADYMAEGIIQQFNI